MEKDIITAEATQAFEDFMAAVWPYGNGDEHLAETPARVARMYYELFHISEPDITLFNSDGKEMVLLQNISFYSLCAHHWLPFYGTAAVAYIPNGKIIGLSKIPRVINYFARSPQVQERLTTDIADYLFDSIPDFNPDGVGVVLKARHMCLEMRGVESPNVETTTSALRGTFKADDAQRAEFMSLIR
jgi:GTP cyclohydrolase I